MASFWWLQRLLVKHPIGRCLSPWSTEIDVFIRRATASGLVTLSELRNAFSAFVSERQQSQEREGSDVGAFCRFLSSRKLLTSWQCDKLQEGRYNGFFFGKYVLTEFVGRDGRGDIYRAEDTSSRDCLTVFVVRRERVTQYSVDRGRGPVVELEIPLALSAREIFCRIVTVLFVANMLIVWLGDWLTKHQWPGVFWLLTWTLSGVFVLTLWGYRRYYGIKPERVLQPLLGLRLAVIVTVLLAEVMFVLLLVVCTF